MQNFKQLQIVAVFALLMIVNGYEIDGYKLGTRKQFDNYEQLLGSAKKDAFVGSSEYPTKMYDGFEDKVIIKRDASVESSEYPTKMYGFEDKGSVKRDVSVESLEYPTKMYGFEDKSSVKRDAFVETSEYPTKMYVFEDKGNVKRDVSVESSEYPTKMYGFEYKGKVKRDASVESSAYPTNMYGFEDKGSAKRDASVESSEYPTKMYGFKDEGLRNVDEVDGRVLRRTRRELYNYGQELSRVKRYPYVGSSEYPTKMYGLRNLYEINGHVLGRNRRQFDDYEQKQVIVKRYPFLGSSYYLPKMFGFENERLRNSNEIDGPVLEEARRQFDNYDHQPGRAIEKQLGRVPGRVFSSSDFRLKLFGLQNTENGELRNTYEINVQPLRGYQRQIYNYEQQPNRVQKYPFLGSSDFLRKMLGFRSPGIEEARNTVEVRYGPEPEKQNDNNEQQPGRVGTYIFLEPSDFLPKTFGFGNEANRNTVELKYNAEPGTEHDNAFTVFPGLIKYFNHYKQTPNLAKRNFISGLSGYRGNGYSFQSLYGQGYTPEQGVGIISMPTGI